MEILNLRPSPGGGNTIARFDLQTPFGIRFYGLALKKNDKGWRVFSPSFQGAAVATFDRELAEHIISAAVTALGEITHNEPSN